jgi:hypothetical protein
MCDPASSSHDRPHRVFTTPAVMSNVSAPRDRVVYWIEHDSVLGRADNHYLVRFYDNAGARACDLQDETDRELVTASGDGLDESEGVTGSPIVFGSPRWVISLGYQGPLTTWSVGPSGWPVVGSGSVVDMSPWDYTVSPPEENRRGGDTSVLVNPATQSLVWGNKCTNDRAELNPEPCGVDAWGKVNIVDLLAPAPPVLGVNSVALDAWISSSPVALSNDAGASGSDFFFVLGTEISTNADAVGDGVTPKCDGSVAPLNAEFDCALTTFLWDGSELAVADHWDAEREFDASAALTSCCEIPAGVPGLPPVLANGWVGEPVPILGGNEIIAAKAHGELYRFEVDPLWGTLSMHHKYRFADPIDDDSDPTFPPRYRIRPEQSPVIGRYPYDPTNYELLVALDDTVEDKTKYLILDVDAWTVGSSMVDPTGFVELETVHRAAGWGPAAAARSFLSDIGPIYDGLTFVVAVGADVPTVGTSVQCPPSAEDGTPPRLYFLTKGHGANPTWTVQHVDLVHDVVGVPPVCYEEQGGGPVPIEYVPIEVVSGVVVQGSMVYVATSDGVFWEYDTSNPNAVIRLQGYSGPWPRFRNNNHGLAQP